MADLSRQLAEHASDANRHWDLSGVTRLDHAGALLLWRAWGGQRAARLTLRPEHEALFTGLERSPSAAGRPRARLARAVRGARRAGHRLPRPRAAIREPGRPDSHRRDARAARSPGSAVARDLRQHLPHRRAGARHHRAGRFPGGHRAVVPVGAAVEDVRRGYLHHQPARRFHHPRAGARARRRARRRALGLVHDGATRRDAGHRRARRDDGHGHTAHGAAHTAQGDRARDLAAAGRGVDGRGRAGRRHDRGAMGARNSVQPVPAAPARGGADRESVARPRQEHRVRHGDRSHRLPLRAAHRAQHGKPRHRAPRIRW